MTGQLRAERSEMGAGRRYTLTYIADDVAEIVACTTTVNVKRTPVRTATHPIQNRNDAGPVSALR